MLKNSHYKKEQEEPQSRTAKGTGLDTGTSSLQLRTEDRGSIPGPAEVEFGRLTWSGIIGGENSAGVSGIVAYNRAPGASESWS